jgi:hypothetical protein
MGEGHIDFAGIMDGFCLVPSEFSDATDVPFLYRLLVELGWGPYYGLSADPAVRAFVAGQPGLYEQIRAVTAVAGRAAVRVRDSGLLHGTLDDNLKYYTPDETWCINLSLDVLLMLATEPGVSGHARFRAIDAVHDLSQICHGHTWSKALRHAADAPRAYGELRARVPFRPAKPGWSVADM